MNDPGETDWQSLLTAGERAQMLQDIAQVALAVGRRLFPDRALDDLDIASGSLLSRKSPVERLGYLCRILPALTAAVEQIAQTPLTLPQKRLVRVTPPSRARRLDRASLLQSVQGGHAARWVHETRTALSADTPENRAVLGLLRLLRWDADAIARMAEAASEPEIAQTAGHCAGRLHGLSQRLGWAGEVADDAAAFAAPPTHRMLSHPVYARFAAWTRQYRQNFAFDWSAPLFALPSRETWRLYEAWGLLQTLEALRTLGFAPTCETPDADRSLFVLKQDRLLFRLAKGEESAIALRSAQGRACTLFYNRTYASRKRSLSRTMRPDITIEADDGATWILDPKFKAYRAPGDEGDDMDQMHAYRDAIVTTQGVKPVRRAWCLYAGRADDSPRPLIAYGPPSQSVVGALCLRPGSPDGFGHLCNLLASWGVV